MRIAFAGEAKRLSSAPSSKIKREIGNLRVMRDALGPLATSLPHMVVVMLCFTAPGVAARGGPGRPGW